MMAAQINEWMPTISHPVTNVHFETNEDGSWKAVCTPSLASKIG